MTNCTCKKWGCDSDCLCNCHREGGTRIHRVKNPLDKVIDLCIDRMQKFNLKK